MSNVKLAINKRWFRKRGLIKQRLLHTCMEKGLVEWWYNNTTMGDRRRLSVSRHKILKNLEMDILKFMIGINRRDVKKVGPKGKLLRIYKKLLEENDTNAIIKINTVDDLTTITIVLNLKT